FIGDVERGKWKSTLFHFRAEELTKFNTPRLCRGNKRVKRVPTIPRGSAPRNFIVVTKNSVSHSRKIGVVIALGVALGIKVALGSQK
ncbi:MAG TPA: hypothetical protein VJH63_03785, partial [Candidatus Paceibacterota bacterium]